MLCLAMLLALLWPGLALADWTAFQRRFVAADGRVLDVMHGGTSTSMGQGLGMLLAALADDRPAFDRLWGWTDTQLRIAPSVLHAWRFDPAQPAARDARIATDGALTIAWALAVGAERWQDRALADTARTMARELLRCCTRQLRQRLFLLPGAEGFATAQGITVNPGIVNPHALRLLSQLAPDPAWAALERDWLWLLSQARFGLAELPADWLFVPQDGRRIRIADGWPPRFGHEAERIIMHLRLVGLDAPVIAAAQRMWSGQPVAPAWLDLTDGRPGGAAGPLIAALRGQPVPASQDPLAVAHVLVLGQQDRLPRRMTIAAAVRASPLPPQPRRGDAGASARDLAEFHLGADARASSLALGALPATHGMPSADLAAGDEWRLLRLAEALPFGLREADIAPWLRLAGLGLSGTRRDGPVSTLTARPPCAAPEAAAACPRLDLTLLREPGIPARLIRIEAVAPAPDGMTLDAMRAVLLAGREPAEDQAGEGGQPMVVEQREWHANGDDGLRTVLSFVVLRAATQARQARFGAMLTRSDPGAESLAGAWRRHRASGALAR